MFGSQKLLYVVLAVAVLGCADQPTSPRTATDTPARSSAHPAGVIRTFDDELEEISLEIPGFAGFYLQDGELIIRGVGSVDSAAIVDAVRAAAISKGLLPPELSAQPAAFRSARYDFRTLVEWKRLLRDQVSDREVLLVDLDELQNVLRVGVASSAAEERVRESLRSIGVPLDGMLVYPTQPAVPEALLTDKFRPIPAGVTSESALGGLCTIGFNAWSDIGLGYVLSSHCSWRFGNLQDGTTFRQNTGVTNTVGFEAADPELTPCAQASVGCRYSDAAFILYDSTSLGQHGTIARPLWLGSKTVNSAHPRFTINQPSYAFLLIGAVVNKVGQTTGWTQGQVLSTCVDVQWTVLSQGATLSTYLLCQFGADYGSDPGDSGAPIFSWNGNSAAVDLRGIHNGRRYPGSSERIFSPWRFIDLELNSYVGSLNVAY